MKDLLFILIVVFLIDLNTLFVLLFLLKINYFYLLPQKLILNMTLIESFKDGVLSRLKDLRYEAIATQFLSDSGISIWFQFKTWRIFFHKYILSNIK